MTGKNTWNEWIRQVKVLDYKCEGRNIKNQEKDGHRNRQFA